VSLVPSLLQAIVHVDGEALVMHAGDKPYVVSPTGQVDLATRGLALEAVNGIVNQLLPPHLQQALEEFGAVQHELGPIHEFPGEHFTIVAARGGDDVWVEIRRRRTTDDNDDVPEELFSPQEGTSSSDPYPVYASAGSASLRHPGEPLPDSLELDPMDKTMRVPAPVAQIASDRPTETPAEELAEEIDLDFVTSDDVASSDAPESPVIPEIQTTPAEVVVAAIANPQVAIERQIEAAVAPIAQISAPALISAPAHPIVLETLAPAAPTVAKAADVHVEAVVAGASTDGAVTESALTTVSAASKEPLAPPVAAHIVVPAIEKELPVREVVQAPSPAVVLPLTRNPIRAEQPPLVDDPTMAGLDRLLRLSAARGASTMYLSSDLRPSVRVDGELQALEGEPVLTARDVESLLLTLMPERSHEALRTGAATEWILDIDDVGRVRCMSFRDHRGPGGVFRLMPTRSVSVDQLGLPRVVQGLAIEPEGLVLVAGPRSSGKRTLISAFVDLINRTRRDHVITIEREINIVHERGSSFISQREVRGGDDDLLAAARAALREDPDVLVIEDLRTAGLVDVALEASASGHLVVGGFPAHTATGAVDRIIDLYAPDHRRHVQLALASNLRGVVVQVLLRKNGGGRVAAREVLLNTPAVSSVIAEGKTSQLPMAIEGGRRYGMMPLNDALVGLVQQGAVDGREAYRYAGDRQGLLAALKHQGVDTSFVERLA
jgi:twitching motility protein PilT